MKCTKCKMPSTDQILFINVTAKRTTTTTPAAAIKAPTKTRIATAAASAAATVATAALTAAAAMQSIAVAAAAAVTITNGTMLSGNMHGFDPDSSDDGSGNGNAISYPHTQALQANGNIDNGKASITTAVATTTTTTTAAAAAVATAALNLATSSSTNTSNNISSSSSSLSSSTVTLANISDSLVEHLSTTLSSAAAAIIDTAGATTATTTTPSNGCAAPQNDTTSYPTYFGVQLSVSGLEAILTVIVLSVIIMATIVGNVLVILSVFTYKPLRIVQNFFIVSLAVADLTVALLVLPFNVAYSILGRWVFGIHLCKMWLTCDILCCTSSILNLCAIALDRYWAITDPINYAQKRTVERVLVLIATVWISSLVISSPPLLGWNDWPKKFTSDTPCELTAQRGYVIYSSLGSFFIPLVIMAIVYIEIFIATRRRLRERAKANKLNTIALKQSEAEAAMATVGSNAATGSSNGMIGKGQAITTYCSKLICCGRDTSNFETPMIQNDQESISSETHVNHDGDQQHQQQQHGGEHRVVVVTQVKKSRRAKIKDSIKHGKARGRNQQTKTTTQAATGATTSPSTSTEQQQQRRTSQNDKQKDKSSAEQLLPATNNANNAAVKIDISDPNEISTESGSDPKGCIQVCVGTEHHHDDENASLKITPPVSSTGAASTMIAMPLQKKPSGVYQFIEEKQKISLSKERRAARTLGIIMGVFVFCWLPFFLMYVILPFCESCCPSDKFKNFITWLGYINSGLNPIIYTIFNLDFRRAFKRLLGIR